MGGGGGGGLAFKLLNQTPELFTLRELFIFIATTTATSVPSSTSSPSSTLIEERLPDRSVVRMNHYKSWGGGGGGGIIHYCNVSHNPFIKR